MKIVLTINNENKIFENVSKFSSYPDKDSPRTSVYITFIERYDGKLAEITEHLELYDSFDIDIEE